MNIPRPEAAPILHQLQKSAAKSLMTSFPAAPDPSRLDLWEIFRHPTYLDASDDEQAAIRLASAQFRYDYESDRSFFDTYYPHFDTSTLEGRSILDLGCFTGGRLVYWATRYRTGPAHGIDINPVFEEAGRAFAAERGVDAEFATGFAESMPYESESLDFIASFDVFEHVQDVEATLRECHRVLKPGGRLLCVFPSYFQPLESHLGLVTRAPALQLLFPGDAIVEAYNEIEDERGAEADWYRREHRGLEPWERLPTLNGITVRRFRQMVRADDRWIERGWNRAPVPASGRRASRLPFRLIRLLFWLPARIPYVEEIFLDRICCELERSS